MRQRLALPIAYVAVAAVAWLDFARLPPDGLANLGLMLVVLPVTLLDLALRPAAAPGHSVFIPDRWGYYTDHAVFYAISVTILAMFLFRIGLAIDRWLARRSRRG